MDDGDAERHREELDEAVEAGGCTEIWETLSEKREDDDSREGVERDSE